MPEPAAPRRVARRGHVGVDRGALRRTELSDEGETRRGLALAEEVPSRRPETGEAKRAGQVEALGALAVHGVLGRRGGTEREVWVHLRGYGELRTHARERRFVKACLFQPVAVAGEGRCHWN